MCGSVGWVCTQTVFTQAKLLKHVSCFKKERIYAWQLACTNAQVTVNSWWCIMVLPTVWSLLCVSLGCTSLIYCSTHTHTHTHHHQQALPGVILCLSWSCVCPVSLSPHHSASGTLTRDVWKEILITVWLLCVSRFKFASPA